MSGHDHDHVYDECSEEKNDLDGQSLPCEIVFAIHGIHCNLGAVEKHSIPFT